MSKSDRLTLEVFLRSPDYYMAVHHLHCARLFLVWKLPLEAIGHFLMADEYRKAASERRKTKSAEFGSLAGCVTHMGIAL